MDKRALVANINLKKQPVSAVNCAQVKKDDDALSPEDALRLAADYENRGADALFITDLSDTDQEHEENLLILKGICQNTDIPVIGAGHIRRMEDVKKLLYAGCRAALLDYSNVGNIGLTKEVSDKFGKEKIGVLLPDAAVLCKNRELIGRYASFAVLPGLKQLKACLDLKIVPILPVAELSELSGAGKITDAIASLLLAEGVCGISGGVVRSLSSLRKAKLSLRESGVCVNLPACSMRFEDFQKNPQGLLPVVIQDYETNDVLMMAYMNEDAYQQTIETGIMTYYSRSRKELWVKGATSGHYQYVKALYSDCDTDTLLAKVNQIGAACHTGSRSCFFQEILKTEYKPQNPMEVLDSVHSVIRDRKLHPKEGSYTNYLFDKGMDKILKKLGEEAVEIIIAAKNPDPEEIKYEISDFLYHVMVLMTEKGVSWEDIMRELSDR